MISFKAWRIITHALARTASENVMRNTVDVNFEQLRRCSSPRNKKPGTCRVFSKWISGDAASMHFASRT
ncbi:MAG: hypothetical protein B0W54_23150 [Cellvibrio sp. 79]|nr:MAG: hypothetical protein B0W54_23150 [Cellvibrio sp. 79]